MPQPLPKHTPYAAWLAGLTLLPEEMEPTRRDAVRAVLQNQQAAERFALGRAPQVAMVPQPYQQQQAQAGAPVWVKATETRSDLTVERGRVLGSVEKKVGQWHADMVSAAARSPSTRIMLGAYPYEAEARLVVEEAVDGTPPAAPCRESTAAWGARMDRESPRSNEKLRIPAGHVESLAIRAMDASAEEGGTRFGEAQNAVRTKHNITDTPALCGRYGKAA